MREFVVFTTQLYVKVSNSCPLVEHIVTNIQRKVHVKIEVPTKTASFFDVFEVTVYTDVHTNKKISKYSFYSV